MIIPANVEISYEGPFTVSNKTSKAFSQTVYIYEHPSANTESRLSEYDTLQSNYEKLLDQLNHTVKDDKRGECVFYEVLQDR